MIGPASIIMAADNTILFQFQGQVVQYRSATVFSQSPD
jgi:hypothetical protein